MPSRGYEYYLDVHGQHQFFTFLKLQKYFFTTKIFIFFKIWQFINLKLQNYLYIDQLDFSIRKIYKKFCRRKLNFVNLKKKQERFLPHSKLLDKQCISYYITYFCLFFLSII